MPSSRPASPVPVLRTLRAASARSSPRTHAASIALAGILIGIAVLALKVAAYLVTGSVALYSDALESTINVVASTAAYAAVRIGARPADERHPFGYTKVEYFSAVLEGVLIALAAFAILHEAAAAALAPRALDAPLLGIAINIAATAGNGDPRREVVDRGAPNAGPAPLIRSVPVSGATSRSTGRWGG